MTLNMAIWRADGPSVMRSSANGIALESQLEDYIESDPTLLGDKVMLIGRQVPTAHGGFIDLLTVDAEGSVHVPSRGCSPTRTRPANCGASSPSTPSCGDWICPQRTDELYPAPGRNVSTYL